MIELSELISELRRELAHALAAGEGEALRFEAGPVQLEVTVAAERAGSVTGRVRFWVVEAGADGRAGQTSTQRITLTLQPRMSSGETPLISGRAEKDER